MRLPSSSHFSSAPDHLGAPPLGLDEAPAPAPADAVHLLAFAASFLWADLAVDARERAFLEHLADELAIPGGRALAARLCEAPPPPEDVDPARVRADLAPAIRRVALRAIAADGRIAEREMDLFDVLDELLPDHGRSAA